MTVSRHMSFPAALGPSVSRVAFEAGRGIFRTGTVPRHIYFIEEGSVRLIRYGREGEEVVLHDARPGEFLAEASLGSSRYHCDAMATESSAVLRVPDRHSNNCSTPTRRSRATGLHCLPGSCEPCALASNSSPFAARRSESATCSCPKAAVRIASWKSTGRSRIWRASRV